MPPKGKAKCKDCENIPRYNDKGNKTPIYCRKCKKDKMVYTNAAICENDDCTTIANYNLPTEIIRRFCFKCKEPGMINIGNKINCEEKKCPTQASFGYEAEKKKRFCIEHVEPGMVNLVTLKKLCQKCKTYACFNYKGLKAIVCKRHVEYGMVNVVSKRCAEKGCDTIPVFNYIGTKTGLYCDEHKEPPMINVIDKLCRFKECYTQPSFNYKHEKSPAVCSRHKEKGMINLINPYCDYCLTLATFGYGKKRSRCVTHKEYDMISIGGKRCFKIDCPKKPHYNHPTELYGKYCREHIECGMLDIRRKKCIEFKCRESPIYGNVKDKKPTKCYKHKDLSMILMDKNSACSIKGCNDEYEHEYNEEKYCDNHIKQLKDYGKIFTAKRICKYCVPEAYDSTFICRGCKYSICRKQEWDAVCMLKRNVKTPFLHDSYTAASECSRRRPDVFFDLGTHIVIVEIDEDQHRRYEPICECSRMSEIIGSFALTPVVFIRYNPGVIKGKYGKIDISKKERLENLVDIVKLVISEVPEPEDYYVKLLQLYYNDNYEVYEEFKEEYITDIVADPLATIPNIDFGDFH